MLAVPKVRAGKAPQLPRLISVGIDRTGVYQKFIFAKSVFGLALLPPNDIGLLFGTTQIVWSNSLPGMAAVVVYADRTTSNLSYT